MKYNKPICELIDLEAIDVISTSVPNQSPSLEDNNNFDTGDGFNC